MTFEWCRRYGIRVVRVDDGDIDHPAIYIEGHSLVLVRRSLPAHVAAEVAEWAITQALAERASLSP